MNEIYLVMLFITTLGLLCSALGLRASKGANKELVDVTLLLSIAQVLAIVGLIIA